VDDARDEFAIRPITTQPLERRALHDLSRRQLADDRRKRDAAVHHGEIDVRTCG
jgi:hypothetical protein